MGMVKKVNTAILRTISFRPLIFTITDYASWMGVKKPGQRDQYAAENHNMPYLPARTPLGENGEPIPSRMKVWLVRTRSYGPLKGFGRASSAGNRHPMLDRSQRSRGGAIELAHAGYTLLQIMEMVTGVTWRWFPATSVTLKLVKSYDAVHARGAWWVAPLRAPLFLLLTERIKAVELLIGAFRRNIPLRLNLYTPFSFIVCTAG